MEYALGLDLGGGPVTVAISRPEGVHSEGALPEGAAEQVADALDRLGDPQPAATDEAGAELARVVTACTDRAATSQDGSPTGVVVAHPSSWGAYRVGLLRTALAASAVAVDVVPAAVAAVTHSTDLGVTRPGDVVAVLDVREDLLEVSVVDAGRDGAAPTVLGTPRSARDLGALDVDDAVLAHVRGVLGGAAADVPRADALLLRVACAQAGAELVTAAAATVTWETGGVRHEVRIVASELDERVRPRAVRAVSAAADAVTAEARTGVDRVLLVGRVAAMPLLAEVVADRFEAPLSVLTADSHPVARGAALLARDVDHAAPDAATPAPHPAHGRRAQSRRSSRGPARAAALLGSGAIALGVAALAATGAALASPGDPPDSAPRTVLPAPAAPGFGLGTGDALIGPPATAGLTTAPTEHLLAHPVSPVTGAPGTSAG